MYTGCHCPVTAGQKGGGVWEMDIRDPRGRKPIFPHPCFCPPPPNNLEYLLAMSKNLAHPLHPVHDDGKGGGWKWWE